ncbi:MAG: hypothetical protein QW727_03110 [Candidatus Pacearchaeota archaeon]
MINEKIILIFALCFVFFMGFSLVMAVHKPSHEINSNNETGSYIRYGLCVKNATMEKNSCYKETQNKYKLCRDDVIFLRKNSDIENISTINTTIINLTEISEINKKVLKNLLNFCRLEYKEELKLCKEEFKENRTQCFEKESHNTDK